MGAPSLFERYLAQCREAADWSKQPDTLFENQARDELLAEGHRIDYNDPLHDMAIAYRIGKIRECITAFSKYVDEAHVAKVREKGGRPPKDFDEIIILSAAYHRCRTLGKAKTKAQLCSIAAKGLGRPATTATVLKALDRLPHLAWGLQSQFGTTAAPDDGAKTLIDIVIAVGKALSTMERAMLVEAGQAAENRKSARFAPVLVCDVRAP